MRPARLASSALAIAGISFTLVAASTATAVAAADPPTRIASTATPSVKTPVSAEITLITGDQVQISNRDGRQAITTKAADRGPGAAPVSFSTFVLRGDTYVAPSDAAVYIGAPLDWSLFDVSALARAGVVNGAQLPLSVDYAPSAQQKALPGMAGVGAAHGTRHAMTQSPANAAKFGAALAAQV